MCGRYASFRQNQDLLDAFKIGRDVPDDPELAQWEASWNVAPTTPVRMVVERVPRREQAAEAAEAADDAAPPVPVRQLRVARWGLVPSWAKDPGIGSRMINARSETLLEKPAFRTALAKHRCLIPADGYYEWRPPAPGAARTAKHPQLIHAPDGGLLAFAGLYEFWRDRTLGEAAPWLVTCTIITTAAEGDMTQIHDRRPAMLTPEAWDAWLDPTTSAPDARALLDARPPELAWHEVSTAVNSVANDGPHLLDPVTPEEQPTLL